MKIFTYTGITTLLMYGFSIANIASAQNLNTENIESSTAILDTAIPFAIGAREGEQTIRGAFGWPTFQEGFVEGVYFRFDPDGYARFSTSPRLDEDVFEIICPNGTTICAARKNSLVISLTTHGKPQIQISGTTPIDRFFISDRKNELPLPTTIIGPLDQRMEALLSTGGDLIIRRERETLQTLSLSGFSATVTYLRWVAQNQASFIFPRGWPIPSQQTKQQNTRPTLSATWADTRPKASLTPKWNSPSPLVNGAKNSNLSDQVWPSSGTQYPSRLPVTSREGSDELSAVGFAEQAQARNLPADINRFENLPPRNEYKQMNNQRMVNHTGNLQNFQIEIKSELARMNQSLINLEVRIENLTLRLSHELISASNRPATSKEADSNIYQTINKDMYTTQINSGGSNEILSQEDKLRKLVLESLLQQSNRDSVINSSPPQTPAAGEITVKKTIVERLLEELNETNTPKDENILPAVESTEEFISISDYINKVMRDEKQQ